MTGTLTVSGAALPKVKVMSTNVPATMLSPLRRRLARSADRHGLLGRRVGGQVDRLGQRLSA